MIQIIEREPIERGWSSDIKYRITDDTGTRYLLRISPSSQRDRRSAQFERMARVAALGVPMCAPIEFGETEEGVYAIHSWIDGVEAEEEIPLLSDTEQYVLGLKSGEILRIIHSITAPDDQEPWETRMNRKVDTKIRQYQACHIQFEGAQAMIDYINENRHLLANRPQTYQHGDYHIGNMMLANGALHIIDFDRDDWGDPWEEFNRIVWCAQKNPLFASGMVNGYFGGPPPEAFWRLLALYISSNTLSSIPWSLPFGQSEVDVMLSQSQEILSWYDGMRRIVPSWYTEGYYLQTIDGIPFKLKSPYDFTFLQKYGRVFRVFDDQDSGNICFGVEKNGAQFFIKFAGAPTEKYHGDPKDAIGRLRATVSAYRELAHETLVRLVASEEIGGGFAAVFEWTDGDCMGRQYPAAHARFAALPLDDKLTSCPRRSSSAAR